jgi:hypothetical protein
MIAMEDAALAAKLWVDGKRQIEIAAMMGKRNAAPVSSAIRAFLLAYSPAFRADRWNVDDRPRFALAALKAFEKKHGAVPDAFSIGATDPESTLGPDPKLVGYARTLSVEQRMSLPLADLPLSVRLDGCLTRGNDFKFVKDIYTVDERQLMRTPNFGRVSMEELREVLAELGMPPLRRGDDLDGYGAGSNPPPVAANGSAQTIWDQFATIERKLDLIAKTLNQILRALEVMAEQQD